MSEHGGPAERSEVAGRDVDEARNLFAGEYNAGEMVIEPTSSAFTFRYTAIGDDELTLRASQFAGHVTGTVLTQGEYIVSWLTAGEGATDLAGAPVKLENGQPAMFANDRAAEFDFADYRQNLMHFDGSFLERVAGEVEGTSGPILFDTTARPSGEQLRRWAASVTTVASVVYDDTSPALLRAEANRAAAIALLETFPHTALHAPVEIGVPSGGKTRAAVEYMIANAHLPIRTEEVAEAVGMSQRSLQAAFRREHDITAIDYLRRVRLDRVQEELSRSDPGRVTVAEIAQRWGFAHLGRFSASYTNRFGEYPSTTLGS
ncbi:helix-turn-helix transcriptional regulator [Plantibacter sp. VKM Ac-2880]|uniref:helix-turn-helix transcriptional regulator n=1 Tax=Plantibacter sp. VKM Ac-2880 TaxID=2783827 RepID=UPI00188E48C0|nr:helix-turn-helix transcriptional regulator [Plantibacter sp. VKM Ac-2880]MBF4567372.1 helix-turn-helix transcriptional regulator [Plantibacter sp. VKM Ac-2880]